MTMKDEDIIRRLRAISGVGTVEGPYVRGNPKWSPMWRWAVRKRVDVLWVVKGLEPFLGTRRWGQVTSALLAGGVSTEERKTGPTPLAVRFDVMYRFASEVCTSVPELVEKAVGWGEVPF